MSRKDFRAFGSRPAAGSSSTSTSGSMASTPANATRRCWPPESSKGLRAAISSGLSPTMRRDRSTRLETSSSESPRLRGPKATSSATVAAKSWFSGYWNTTPTRPRTSLAAPFSAMLLPKATTRPLVGCRMPFMCWMRVDLPDPVCPAMPKNSPLRTLRETLSSAQSASGELPHFACLGAGFLPALRCRRASAAS